jgi:hypothetical protein
VSAVDEVAARLYALPPEEFTAARNEAVAAARAAGDRDLARAIGALRRPTVGAWLVNLLAHQRPDLIGELFTLGGALRAAQRNLRGDELRELSVQRRTMIVALARQARALAIAAGRGVRDALPLAEVETTLGAALADDEVAEQVRLGRLVKTTEYAGFGEAPRPQLRLVHGGSRTADQPAVRSTAGAVADPGEDEPAEDEPEPAEPEPAGTGKGAAGKRAAEAAVAARKAAAAERAEAVRKAREREAAERTVAAERRRRQQAAHRELLAARTVLAEAEAQRATAERAVRDARRRVEAALAATEALRVSDDTDS